MKFIQGSVLALFALSFSACATTKYKSYSSADALKAQAKAATGKSPKEAAQIMGKPMSAFFTDDAKNEYHMVYPKSESEVSMTDLMFNDRLECMDLIFEKDKGYKYEGWSTNVGYTCGAIKGQKLDTSMID